MVMEEKERQKALICGSATAYRKYKIEALQQRRVNVSQYLLKHPQRYPFSLEKNVITMLWLHLHFPNYP